MFKQWVYYGEKGFSDFCSNLVAPPWQMPNTHVRSVRCVHYLNHINKTVGVIGKNEHSRRNTLSFNES